MKSYQNMVMSALHMYMMVQKYKDPTPKIRGYTTKLYSGQGKKSYEQTKEKIL